MDKYIKAREIENLKCYLDEKVENAKTAGICENDPYYGGKVDAFKRVSEILDELLNDAADIFQDDILSDIQCIIDRCNEEYFDNEMEIKETKGLSPYLSGKNSIIYKIVEELNEVVGAYE